MEERKLTALFDPRPRELVLRDLVARSRRRMEGLTDPQLSALLEDALFHERKRLEKDKGEEEERAVLDDLARSLVRGDRNERIELGLKLVHLWADEVHGFFNPRVYRFATRVLPRALGRLLSGRAGRLGRALGEGQQSANGGLRVAGDIGLVRDLVREGTVILAPTHVSNLDSRSSASRCTWRAFPPSSTAPVSTCSPTSWWAGGCTAWARTPSTACKEGDACTRTCSRTTAIRSLTTHHHSPVLSGRDPQPGAARSRPT